MEKSSHAIQEVDRFNEPRMNVFHCEMCVLIQKEKKETF